MGKQYGRQHTTKFKFQMVLETRRSEKADAEVAQTYQVHPIPVSKSKKDFLEKASQGSAVATSPPDPHG